MAWTSAVSISLKTDWQYTEPIEGAFFRLKHTSFPVKGQFQIAQAEFNADNSVNLTEPLTIDAGAEYDTLTLLPPSHFVLRRLAIRKLSPEPTLESQLRKVLVSSVVRAVEENFFLPRRSAWSVAIEVGDVSVPSQEVTDYSQQFNSLNQQLTTVRGEIAALSTQLAAVGVEVSKINSKISTSEPTPTNTDPSFNSVVLLLHMDGANNSTTFIDIKGKTVTPFGNVKISTAQSKFGGASAYFDGADDYLSVPGTDFAFGPGDFTIEGWLWAEAYNFIVFDNRSSPAGAEGLLFFVNSAGRLRVYSANGYSNDTGAVVPLNSWNHIAYTRSGTAHKLFLNGVVNHEFSLNANFSSTSTLFIGRTMDASVSSSGFLEDYRVTKGIARYTNGFTVPSQPFSNS